jgi:hypothetical protein
MRPCMDAGHLVITIEIYIRPEHVEEEKKGF